MTINVDGRQEVVHDLPGRTGRDAKMMTSIITKTELARSSFEHERRRFVSREKFSPDLTQI